MMDKKEAARVLEDEIFWVLFALQKARAAMEPITTRYFFSERVEQKNEWKILCDYELKRPYAFMADDYIQQALDLAQEMRDLRAKEEAEGCLN